MTDLRQQAEALYEQRMAELRKQAEQEKEAEKEQGIQGAIRELQKQRSEERMAEARREALAEANEIARERYELAEELEEAAANLNHLLGRYEALDGKHRSALSRAGLNPGHDHSLRPMVRGWFAHRFGGHGSLAGIAGSHPNHKERHLSERDPLAHP